MTSQVSTSAITSRSFGASRRYTGVLSFFLILTVLALTVNMTRTCYDRDLQTVCS